MTIKSPRQLYNGAHIIPIYRIRCSGCDSYEAATGTVRWDMGRGISFSINFPDVHQSALPQYWHPPAGSSGVGRFSSFSEFPNWTAETAEGHAVKLFGTHDEPTSKVHYGTSGSGCGSRISGTALFVEVDLPNNSPLSFHNSTLPHPRMLFIGHDVRHWENIEEVEFTDKNSTIITNRCTARLSESPDVRIVSADVRIKLPTAVWLTFDPSHDVNPLDYPYDSERSFISFLNGRSVPFMWMDMFKHDNVIRRVYYGWSRILREDTDFTDTEPLPMYGSVESFQYGKDVSIRLPHLFQRWMELSKEFEFDWILSPLWVARRSFLDDKVALASISLERLAAEWRGVRNRIESEVTNSDEVWRDRRLIELKKQLLAVVDTFDSNGKLSPNDVAPVPELAVALRMVRNKINSNVFSPPNMDKLTLVFQDLGLPIADVEQQTINFRNRALHGSRTLGGNETSDFDEDAHRYDIFRMLVIKAILSILRYDGPFINYAARPQTGNFPVESLQLKPT